MKNEDILDFQICKKHFGSWIMSHGLFFQFLIYDWCMSQLYAICIYYDSDFCDDFHDDKNLENPPTQKLKFWIS